MAPAKKILCVEDDLETASLIAEEFEERGYEITLAHDGQAGFAAVLKRQPDIVLCDVSMPVMSGFAFLEELTQRSDRERVNVLLISANAQVEQVARVKGVVGFVRKPFDLDDVLALVDNHAR